MPKRSYVSPLRAAAASETRERVVEAAGRLLREEATIAGFSLEAVAKAAGVTRLTVYNQFGSRRGLLEAAFDERAREGGLGRLQDAMAMPDADAALDRVIRIFCDFWSSDAAMGRLHDATALDKEFAEALKARHERRRTLIKTLVDRIAAKTQAGRSECRDAVDLIFALTSYALFDMLRRDRSAQAISAIVTSACHAALAGLRPSESADR